MSPELWPAIPPPGALGLCSLGLYLLSSLAVGYASRQLVTHDRCWALVPAIALLTGASAVGFWAFAGVSPHTDAYGAIVHTVLWLNVFFGLVVILMALYCLARRVAGMLDRNRRVTFDNMRIFWHYVVAQAAAGIVLLYGFPRWVG